MPGARPRVGYCFFAAAMPHGPAEGSSCPSRSTQAGTSPPPTPLTKRSTAQRACGFGIALPLSYSLMTWGFSLISCASCSTARHGTARHSAGSAAAATTGGCQQRRRQVRGGVSRHERLRGGPGVSTKGGAACAARG